MVDEKTRTQISWSAAVLGAASAVVLLGMILFHLTGGGDFGVNTRRMASTIEPLVLGILALVVLSFTADVAAKPARLAASAGAAFTGALFALIALLGGIAVLSELPVKQRRRESGLETAELLGNGLIILGTLAVALVLAAVAGLIAARVANVTIGGSGGTGTAGAVGPTPQPGYGGDAAAQTSQVAPGYVAPQPQPQPQPQPGAGYPQQGFEAQPPAPQHPQQDFGQAPAPGSYAPPAAPQPQPPAPQPPAPQAPQPQAPQQGYPQPGAPADPDATQSWYTPPVVEQDPNDPNR